MNELAIFLICLVAAAVTIAVYKLAEARKAGKPSGSGCAGTASPSHSDNNTDEVKTINPE